MLDRPSGTLGTFTEHQSTSDEKEGREGVGELDILSLFAFVSMYTHAFLPSTSFYLYIALSPTCKLTFFSVREDSIRR